MKNINKICAIIIALCIILVVGICVFLIGNHKERIVSDAQKFKDEYELLNNYEQDDIKFSEVNIDIDNPIIYKTGKEIVEVLKNEDAVVFFGFASSKGSRLVIETLLEAAKEKNIEKLYYVDIKDMRDEYKYNGTLVPEKIKSSTNAYKDITKLLSKHLEEYYVWGTDGNLYDTGVLRLMDPTVVAVSNGKVTGFHAEVSDQHKDFDEPLTAEEKKDLKSKYIEVIGSINKNMG